MSARILPWLLVALAAVFAAGPARAAVELEVPNDWARSGSLDQSAIDRARQWAQVLGGELERTEGSANVDNFVETLAVIDFALTMKASALESDEAAQTYLDAFMAPLVGDAKAEKIERKAMPGSKGAVSIRGSYVVGGIRIQAVLIPEATATSLVLIGSLESEKILYAPILDRLLDSLQGGAAPVTPYAVDTFRRNYIIAWLLLFVCVYFGSVAGFSERKGDHKRVGLFAGGILAGLSVVGAAGTYFMLSDADAGLAAVSLSAGDLAGEVFGMGALGALIIVGLGQLLESESGVIQSAPESTVLSAQLSTLQANAEHDSPTGTQDSGDDLGPASPTGKPSIRDDAPTPALPRAAKVDPVGSAKGPGTPGSRFTPPPSTRRPPPPPSSAHRRVETSPIHKGGKASLEPARAEPAQTVRIPNEAVGPKPKK